MSIQYTVETLHHFRCMECNQWWSIGDIEKSPVSHLLVTCPNCGNDETATPMKEKK